MAESSLVQSSVGDPTRAVSMLRFLRVYRAHVTAASSYGPERTAFVEASSHHGAAKKIAQVIAALELRTPEDVEDRIYNVYSAHELIAEGVSEDLEARLFETGVSGGRATFVENPMFLTSAPELIRKWAKLASAGHMQVKCFACGTVWNPTAAEVTHA